MRRLIRPAILAGLIGLVLGAIAGAALAFATPTRYQSESQVFVSVRSGISAAERSQAARDLVATYTELAGSDAVLVPAAGEVGLPVQQARDGFTATTSPGTALISLRTQVDDPVRARELNAAVVRELQRLFNSLENPPGSPADAALVQVTPPADGVAKDGRTRTIGLLAGAGLLLGVGVAYLRWRRDPRIGTPPEPERIAPAPGEVITLSGGASPSTLRRVASVLDAPTVVVTHDSGSSPFAEQLADWFTDNGTPVTFIDRRASTEDSEDGEARLARAKMRDGARVVIDAPDLTAPGEVAAVAREADVVVVVDVDRWSARDLTDRLAPIRNAAANLIVLARTPAEGLER